MLSHVPEVAKETIFCFTFSYTNRQLKIISELLLADGRPTRTDLKKPQPEESPKAACFKSTSLGI